MRLVVVAALGGHLRDRHPRSGEKVDGAAEARDASDHARRQPDVLTKSRRQMLAAAAELARQLANRDRAARRAETTPGQSTGGGGSTDTKRATSSVSTRSK